MREGETSRKKVASEPEAKRGTNDTTIEGMADKWAEIPEARETSARRAKEEGRRIESQPRLRLRRLPNKQKCCRCIAKAFFRTDGVCCSCGHKRCPERLELESMP